MFYFYVSNPLKQLSKKVSRLRPYPVRLVMVPNVIGCLICARGISTIKLGRGESRGLPGLLLAKLLQESWLFSFPTKRKTKKSITTGHLLHGWSLHSPHQSFKKVIKGRIDLKRILVIWMGKKKTQDTVKTKSDLIINRDCSLWGQRNGGYRIGQMLNGHTNNQYKI